MSTRPTKEFKTSSGRTVVLNEYLTGGEFRQIQAILMDRMSTKDVTDGLGGLDNLPATSMFKAQDRALELLVVSVDGNTENAYQAVLDMPQDESDQFFTIALDHLGGADKKKVSSEQSVTTPTTE